VFSDLIWENVLDKAQWLEHYSPNHIFLFKMGKESMESIIIHAHTPNADLTTEHGLVWLNENIFSDDVNNPRKKILAKTVMAKYSALCNRVPRLLMVYCMPSLKICFKLDTSRELR
jgi:hypothetical protein